MFSTRILNPIVENRLPRIYPVLSNQLISKSSYSSQINQQELSKSEPKWSTIYKFPQIGIIASLNKAKWYQLGATILGTPIAYALEAAGQLGPNSGLVCGIVGIGASLSVTIFALLSQRTIGFMYLNEEKTRVKFGFVDFNGKRVDSEFDIDDIKPLSEFEEKQVKYYIPIVIKGQKDKLRLFHRYGIIVDVSKFNFVLD